MAKTVAKREPSKPVGLYFECPFRIFHPQQGIAIPIFRGPKKFFAKCPSCRSDIYFSIAWKSSYGLSYQQALALGLRVDVIFPVERKA